MGRFYRNVVQKLIGENRNAKYVRANRIRGVNYKNNYYVYEHIKLDDNTCIYVGKSSGREIYVYNSDGEFIRRFDYIGECAIWFKKYLHIDTKPTTIRCVIINYTKVINFLIQKYKIMRIHICQPIAKTIEVHR